MLVIVGVLFGVQMLVVDGIVDVCVGQVVLLVVVDWYDQVVLGEFVCKVDVVIFDFENVLVDMVYWLVECVVVFLNFCVLVVVQDCLVEKILFCDCGFVMLEFVLVDICVDFDCVLVVIGVLVIFKMWWLGYDGKGQFCLCIVEDVDVVWVVLGVQVVVYGLIFEVFVLFECEFLVLVVCGCDGDFCIWLFICNWYIDGVFSLSLVLVLDIDVLQLCVIVLVCMFVEWFDYVGVFVLELFVKDGELFGNEMVLCVYNFGYWIIEGVYISQFENYVCVVFGLLLGDIGVYGVLLMFNWIGELFDFVLVLCIVDGYWYDYGKQVWLGCKVGYVMVCVLDVLILVEWVEVLVQLIGWEQLVVVVCGVFGD